MIRNVNNLNLNNVNKMINRVYSSVTTLFIKPTLINIKLSSSSICCCEGIDKKIKNKRASIVDVAASRRRRRYRAAVFGSLALANEVNEYCEIIRDNCDRTRSVKLIANASVKVVKTNSPSALSLLDRDRHSFPSSSFQLHSTSVKLKPPPSLPRFRSTIVSQLFFAGVHLSIKPQPRTRITNPLTNRNPFDGSTSLTLRTNNCHTNFQSINNYSTDINVFANNNKKMGVFKFSDYDCIGFDLDNTLLRYNVTNMVNLEYECLAKFAVEKRGHDSKHLYRKLGPNDFDFMQKGLIIDFERGNIVRLSPDGKILRASHGTKLLNQNKLEAIYPDGRWEVTDAFTSDPLVTWNGPLSEKMRTLLDYFDMPASLVFAKIVDTIDETRGNDQLREDYSVWPDVLDGLVDMFSRDHFAADKGTYFPALKENPEKYFHRSDEKLVAWLKDLKKTKLTFLVTGSNADFANFTASYALGKDWKSLFDVVICYAKKPGFFTSDRPFVKVKEDFTEGDIVLGSDLKRGEIYSQGNWKEITEFFARETGKESPDCLYVGDNLIQDIYTPNRHANCDTVAVVEEQLAEGMLDHSLSHGDKELLNSNIWGSYFHVESKGKLSPSIWSHFIYNYSKICVPSVDFLVNDSLDVPIKSFGNEEDRKLCGYHPGKPKSVADMIRIIPAIKEQLSILREEPREDTKINSTKLTWKMKRTELKQKEDLAAAEEIVREKSQRRCPTTSTDEVTK